MSSSRPNKPIEIVVLDACLDVRGQLRSVFRDRSDATVVGSAVNAERARLVVQQHRPDLVLLNADLPPDGGLEMLRSLREWSQEQCVLVYSNGPLASRDADLSILSTPKTAYLELNLENLVADREKLLGAVLGMFDVVIQEPPSVVPLAPLPSSAGSRAHRGPNRFGVLAIGSSTGGPDALAAVFRGIPANLPVPVVVAQHIPEQFTQVLAERLDAISALSVHEGVRGTVLQPGNAYIAPGGRHMVLERHGDDVRIATNRGPLVHFCRPAVDPLFESVVEVYGARTLSLVLTGMGRDGAAGCVSVRAAGGWVVVQDQATSVVWGMPGEVVRAGAADEVLPLDQIAPALARALGLEVPGDPLGLGRLGLDRGREAS